MRLFVPCFAGDYIEIRARILKEEDEKTLIEVRSFKVAQIPEKPKFASSIDVLEDPPLSTLAIFEYEIPKKKLDRKSGNKALSGIRVLDLTHAYNGPFCTTLLGDNGAEVIKFEPIGGEQCRFWPPIDEKTNESGFYAFLNRNKKGCTINLKSDKGREIFYKLVKEADIVVENFRPGVTKKLKVDYETLKKINPGIIYASGTGFGQYGPLSHRPCYDIVAQSLAGMVNITGYPDTPPVKVGASIADNVTGIYLCVGVLMALYRRSVTGKGQHVDVAMADTIFTLLENAIVTTTLSGTIPQRQGNIDLTIAPFNIYEAEDGYVALGVGNDKLFKVFCDVIGRSDLVQHPKYCTNDLRVKNYNDGLHDIIVQWVKKHKKRDIEEMFDKVGIPCGPVLDMKEAIEHPQFQEREMMVHMEHPLIGDMYFQGCPIKLSATPGSVDTPAPMLGQHNKEIYGLSDAELEELKKEGII